jgi:hypothetical protein
MPTSSRPTRMMPIRYQCRKRRGLLPLLLLLVVVVQEGVVWWVSDASRRLDLLLPPAFLRCFTSPHHDDIIHASFSIVHVQCVDDEYYNSQWWTMVVDSDGRERQRRKEYITMFSMCVVCWRDSHRQRCLGCRVGHRKGFSGGVSTIHAPLLL